MLENVAWFVILYLCALPLIGIWGRLRAREATLKDYYLAGGALSLAPLFLTLYATQYSGNTLLGFAGNAYRSGPVVLFSAGGMIAVVGALALFGRKLNALAASEGFITVADFIRHRYSTARLVRLINLILIFGLGSYVLTNFKAIGHVTTQLSGGTIDPLYGMLGLAAIMAFYESMGGLRSVVWTDMIQGTLLLLGCLGVVVLVLVQFDGAGGLMRELTAISAPQWGQADGQFWVRGVSLVVLFGAAISLYPHAIQRLFAARDWPTLRNSLRLMLLMPFLTTIPIVLSAMAAFVLLDPIPAGETDQVILRLVEFFMNAHPILTWFLALFMAAALAAIMSTLDSAMLALGAIFTHDFIRPNFPQASQARLTQIGRAASWGLTLVMVYGALALPQSIWDLAILKFDVMAQAFPAFALGAVAPRIGGREIFAGAALGLAVALGLRYGLLPDIAAPLHFGVSGLLINFLTIAALYKIQAR